MSETRTVTVQSVETREGTSAKTGKPWKIYRVSDGNSDVYSTFDGSMGAHATQLQGKRATIGFETTEKGRNLISIEEFQEPHAEINAKTETGEPDWDLKSLRITRVALWKPVLEYLAKALLAVPPDERLKLRDAYMQTGRYLVSYAEQDIYQRAPLAWDDFDAADPDAENIPF